MDPASSDDRIFVPDTSVFVNPDSRTFFGPTTGEALARFVDAARHRGVQCLVPPSVYRELTGFVGDKGEIRAHLALFVQKTPSLSLTVPAEILRRWVGDLRRRVDRGLRSAERAVRNAARGQAEDATVRRLRNDYRTALREGAVDSIEDLDLVLLAYEVGGLVITADAGIRSFGEALGVGFIDPRQAADYLGLATHAPSEHPAVRSEGKP